MTISLVALGSAQYLFWNLTPGESGFLLWFSVLGFFSGIYFGWLPLSASTPLTLAKAFPAILVKRVATLFNEGTNSVGLAGVGVQNPVNSG